MVYGISRSPAENGVEAWDCLFQDHVLLNIWALAFQGDNPMASEFSSHIGMSGKLCCRICRARGLANSPVDIPPPAPAPNTTSSHPPPPASEAAPAPANAEASVIPDTNEPDTPLVTDLNTTHDHINVLSNSTSSPSSSAAIPAVSLPTTIPDPETATPSAAPGPIETFTVNPASTSARLEEEANIRQFIKVSAAMLVLALTRRLISAVRMDCTAAKRTPCITSMSSSLVFCKVPQVPPIPWLQSPELKTSIFSTSLPRCKKLQTNFVNSNVPAELLSVCQRPMRSGKCCRSCVRKCPTIFLTRCLMYPVSASKVVLCSARN